MAGVECCQVRMIMFMLLMRETRLVTYSTKSVSQTTDDTTPLAYSLDGSVTKCVFVKNVIVTLILMSGIKLQTLDTW